MRRLQPFFSLTGLTALETLRQPIVLLLFAACVVLTGSTPLFLLQPFGEYGKLARESGLAFHFVFGLLLAGYAAGSSVAREVQSGTATVVLSKPISRSTFFLAKFAGLSVVLAAFSAGAIVTTLLSARVAQQWTPTAAGGVDLIDWHTGGWLLAAPAIAMAIAALLNYFRRFSFASTAFLLMLAVLLIVFVGSGAYDRAGQRAAFDFRVDWRILPAGVLITLALAVVAAIAASLSTRLPIAPTLAICSLILVVGLLWEHLVGPSPDSLLQGMWYGLIPNWQHFWVSDALTGGGRIPWTYVGDAAAYAAACIGVALSLGTASFEWADL